MIRLLNAVVRTRDICVLFAGNLAISRPMVLRV